MVGDTQAAAATAITTAGLTVGTVTQASSTTVASGDVVTESPASGTSVAGGSAVALTISSGPPTYTVGGIVIGLGTSATVHVLNGADSVAVTANGSFTLPAGIISGGAYSVTVGTPTSAQSCAAQNAAGTIASANVTNVVVYCTYKVSVATLNNTYTVVGADFDSPSNGTTLTFDALVAAIYNGAGSINTTSTVDIGGTIYTGVAGSGTYAVTTTTAIPTFTNSTGASGGIQGVNGAAAVSAGTMSGTPSSIGVAVFAQCVSHNGFNQWQLHASRLIRAGEHGRHRCGRGSGHADQRERHRHVYLQYVGNNHQRHSQGGIYRQQRAGDRD